MRRKDKEVKDIKQMERIIAQALVCRLGLYDGSTPYIVPLSFGYEPGHLYFHSVNEGKKIDLIRQNPHVGFEMDIGVELVEGEIPCAWTMRYESLIGHGQAFVIEETEAKREALRLIFRHYSEAEFTIPREAMQKLVVIRVDIDFMSAKASQDILNADSD